MTAKKKSRTKARTVRVRSRPRRGRSGGAKAKPAAKTKPARGSVARAKAKPAARRQPARAGKPLVDPAELVRALELKVRRVAAARRTLEKRLTAAVQEIGSLRHFELRATQLEEELRKRDVELALLRSDGAAGAAP